MKRIGERDGTCLLLGIWIPGEPSVDAGPMDAEAAGGVGDIAAGLFERALDEQVLGFGERDGVWEGEGLGRGSVRIGKGRWRGWGGRRG